MEDEQLTDGPPTEQVTAVGAVSVQGDCPGSNTGKGNTLALGEPTSISGVEY